MSCPKDMIQRKEYTRKNGVRVKATCIRRTRALKTHKVCPPGKVSRSSYTRHFTNSVRKLGYTRKTKTGKEIKVFPKKNSVYVPSSCINDVGKPGKLPDAPRIGPLRKGELKKFGYSYKLPDSDRRRALEKAVKVKGALDIFHKLDAVAKLSKRAAPAASKTFAEDRDWVKKTYGGAAGDRLSR
jgi:Family of unknown function (DUF5771)